MRNEPLRLRFFGPESDADTLDSCIA